MSEIEHKNDEMRVVIDGFSYDISAFKNVHPGGSVVGYYKNLDGSDAFEAFHFRSPQVSFADFSLSFLLTQLQARKWLATLPRRPVTPTDPSDDSPLIQDFRELRKQLVKERFFDPMWSTQVNYLLLRGRHSYAVHFYHHLDEAIFDVSSRTSSLL